MISNFIQKPVPGDHRIRLCGAFVTALAIVLFVLLATAASTLAAWPRGAELVSMAPGPPRAPATNKSQLPSISADGRYVVFLSTAGDIDLSAPIGGIFRVDRQTGSVALVAARLGPPPSCNGAAGRPWVSADGRYVAFETAEALIAADTNSSRDVYVRDMTVAAGNPGAFELVSALNGASTPATYATTGCAGGARIPDSARALSFDGRRVLFTTNKFTNLPSGGDTDTPHAQLYMRNLTTDATTLVTRTIDDPLTPAHETAGLPIDLSAEDAPPLPMASISGDGTTVSWVGVEARQQTPFHAAENENAGTGLDRHYLWRRVSDGPLAPTRRVAGLVDMDAPGCDPSDENVDVQDNAPEPGETADPCLGQLANTEWDGHYCSTLAPPALDLHGYRVAYLTCAELRHAGPRPQPIEHDVNGDGFHEGEDGDWTEYPTLLPVKTQGEDVFITDMSPGVRRIAGTRELTRTAGNVNEADLAGALIDRLDFAANADRLAFVTLRAAFNLPNPTPIGTMPTTKDRQRVFVIDNLSTPSNADDTLQWVTRSHAADSNEDLEAGVAVDVALDATGDTLVFSTMAGDVFYGDGNSKADVFATDGPAGPPAGPRVTISSPTPSQVLASADVSVSYSTFDATSIVCKLDGGSSTACGSSPLSYSRLAEGTHTISITAGDGDLSNTVVRSFGIDLPEPLPASPPLPTPLPTPVASLALGKATTLPNGSAKLTVTVSGAGSVKLLGTAKLLKKKKLAIQNAGTGTATTGASGPATVNFKLNALAKKQLKAKGKLAVAVTATFTPSAGSPVIQKLTIVFKAKKKK